MESIKSDQSVVAKVTLLIPGRKRKSTTLAPGTEEEKEGKGERNEEEEGKEEETDQTF